MRFRDVVLCDNEACGAILRLGGATTISVQLEHDVLGAFFYCPRCGFRTVVELNRAEKRSMARRSAWARSRLRPSDSRAGDGIPKRTANASSADD